MGKGGGGKTNSGSGVSDQIPSNYRWLRKSSADHLRFVDIDRLDKPETVGQLTGMLSATFPLARRAPTTFEELVKGEIGKRNRKVDVAEARRKRKTIRDLT